LSKPRLGELVAALFGLGLLAASLFPWYESEPPVGSLSAWEAFDVIDVVMLLAIACAVLIACVDWFRISVSLPVAGSAATGLFASVAIVLVLFRIIDPPGGGGVEREPALYVGFACLVGILLGAIVGMMEERPARPMTAPAASR
jgi:hypothetical protein